MSIKFNFFLYNWYFITINGKVEDTHVSDTTGASTVILYTRYKKFLFVLLTGTDIEDTAYLRKKILRI